VLGLLLAIAAPAAGQIGPLAIGPGVAVSPDGAIDPSRVPNTGNYAVAFSVFNSGNTSLNLDVTCVGRVNVVCVSSSASTLSIASGARVTVNISYRVTSTGTGRVVLFATQDGGPSDSGWVKVPVAGVAGKPGVVLKNENRDNVSRSLCVTAGAGEAATFQCGALVITHAMPAFRAMGRDRSLTLLYNSDQATPAAFAAAIVTQRANIGKPTAVYTELTVGGALKDSATYAPWGGLASDVARQIVNTFDAAPDSTGVYTYTFLVRNIYGSSVLDSSLTGRFIVVNRKASQYGAGWWLAGEERLHFNQPVGTADGSILWVGGDGSPKLYTKLNDSTWLAALGGFQDTIAYSSANKRYTRKLRYSATVTFDTVGRHILTKDRFGRTTTFFRNTAGRLDSIVVPPARKGSAYRLTYDGAGKLDQIRDPGNRILNATVGGGRLTSLVDPDGKIVSFTYPTSTATSITGRTNRRGYVTTYGAGSLLGSVKVALDSPVTTFATTLYTAWQAQGSHAAIHTGLSNAVDTASATTRIIGPRESVNDDVTFWVDRWGAPVTIQDPNGAITRLVRSDPAHPALTTKVVHPNGRIDSLTYNSRGNLVETRDSTWHLDQEATRITAYDYNDVDAIDSPSASRVRVGSTWRTTTYSYNAKGLPDTVTDSRGHRTLFTYTGDTLPGLVRIVTAKDVETWVDSAGFTTDTSSAILDQVQSFTFDTLGNLKSMKSPTGVTTAVVSDPLGRVTDTYDPLGTRQGWTYDPMNRVTMNTRYTAKFAVDTAGCRRSQALCGIDSTAAMDPDLGPTIASSYFYNGNGLDSLRDARGVTRRFTYDGRDLMIAQTDEHQRVDRIFRDGGGLVALSTSRQSDTARYVYDPGGRRRAVVYQRLWSAKTAERIPEDSISYQYDVDDNVLLDSNRIAKIRRTYYGNGAVKTEVVKGLRTDSVQYTYDGSGALVRSARTYNGKTDVIDYTFSAATGELQSITATWGPPANRSRTINFVWDALGRRKRVTLPNGSAQGIRVEYRYDAAGVLRRVMSTNGQDDITKSNRFDFTYKADSVDVAGHILSSKTTCPRIIAGDSDPTGSPCGSGPMVRISNRYNRLGMMARQYDGVLETYKYDASGNMIYRKRGSAAAHYFTMDPQSNQVQRDSAAGVTTNGVKGYAYDWDGDRIYDSVATSLTTIYYTDALGRTVGIRDYAHNGSNRSDCVQYDPDGNMITPCDDDGNQLTYEGPSVAAAHPTRWVFVRGPGVDDPLMALWRPLATSSSDTTEWYFVTDGQGRQLAVATGNGSFSSTDAIEYNSRGGAYAGDSKKGTTFSSSRFETQAVPGFSFYRNRVYDQGSGRWTQEDPAGLGGGSNLYQFNGNNPVMYTDPFGLCKQQDAGNCTQSDVGKSDLSKQEDHRSWWTIAVGATISNLKAALRKVHEEVGKLSKGSPGKWGSPQRGNSEKGYRLDPGHPGRSPEDPEAGEHVNWWDWTGGKKGSGGRWGSVRVGPEAAPEGIPEVLPEAIEGLPDVIIDIP